MIPARMRTIGDLSETLRAARLAAGMTQQELADFSGISRKTIIQIEKGQASPSADLLMKLLGLCNLDLVLWPRGGSLPRPEDLEDGPEESIIRTGRAAPAGAPLRSAGAGLLSEGGGEAVAGAGGKDAGGKTGDRS